MCVPHGALKNPTRCSLTARGSPAGDSPAGGVMVNVRHNPQAHKPTLPQRAYPARQVQPLPLKKSAAVGAAIASPIMTCVRLRK